MTTWQKSSPSASYAGSCPVAEFRSTAAPRNTISSNLWCSCDGRRWFVPRRRNDRGTFHSSGCVALLLDCTWNEIKSGHQLQGIMLMLNAFSPTYRVFVLVTHVPHRCTLYGLRSHCSLPWFVHLFQRYINSLCTSFLTYFELFLPYLYSLICLLPVLFTSLRIGPFHFQLGGLKKWWNLALVFCVVVYWMHVCFCFLFCSALLSSIVSGAI